MFRAILACMKITPIKTHCILPLEPLEPILDQYISKLPNNSILAITSKIISVSQNRLVPKGDKKTLIYQEADLVLKTKHNPYDLYLTLKNNILIPSAGIDESNSQDSYILYPNNIQEVAARLWSYLRQKQAIKNLGIIITDSHTTPLRWGVTGITLGWCGFEPLYSYVGKPDIYNHPLKVTQINLLDALASAAVLVMGEGNEQTPLALIQDAPKITFQDTPPTPEQEKSITISFEEDLYGPLLQGGEWE